MRLFKVACLATAVLVTFSGCGGSSTGSDGGDNGDGNGDGGEETTEYSLSASASPSEGGSVDPSSGTFEEGEEVTVEATANSGWSFSDWSGDLSSQENPITFTINRDTDLTANFEEVSSKYTVEMTLSDGTESLDLGFGQAEEGSDEFDEGLDEDAPPSPPSGALHGFFEIGDLELFRDFRNDTGDQVEWTLQYQIDSEQDLELSWTIADDTNTPGTLTLSDQEGSFEVDMFSQSSHTVSGTSSGTLIITYNL